MADRIFEGTIDHWSDRGDAAGFGFIECSLGGPRLDRIFYGQNDILPDAIGRRLHGRILGNLVRFRLGKHVHRGQPTAKAVDIESVFPVDIANPQAHREVSVIDNIVAGSRGPVASVFLLRSSGDKLYLGYDGVAEAHRDRFPHLKRGDHVWHGVEPPAGNQKLFRAVHAEFYSPEEENAMRENPYGQSDVSANSCPDACVTICRCRVRM
jgi:hypothetical protein